MPHRPMLALALPILLLALLAVPCPLLTADEGSEGAADGPPVELGAVAWLRSFDTGAARAKAEQKPILLLFQEVPG